MKTVSRYLGLLGLVLALGGGLGYAVTAPYPVYYLIFGLAGLLLAFYVVGNFRELVVLAASRSARFGAGSAMAVALVLGILVFTALLTSRHSYRWDLTRAGRYTLAPQTVKVLDGLENEVKATGFFQGGVATADGAAAREMFSQYGRISPKFTFEIVDPDRFPDRAKAAGISEDYGYILVETGGRSDKFQGLSEERLTNALLRVTRTNPKKIYFLTGHGEKDLEDLGNMGYSTVKSKLEGEGYQVERLLLMQKSSVPEDAAVLVVAGPEKDPLDAETAALEHFLRSGGKVLFLVDPETCPGLAGFLQRLGVKLGQDVIVDKMARLFGGGYLMPLAGSYTQHPVTANFTLATFYPLARSVSVTEEKPRGVNAVILVATSDEAWAETNLAHLKAANQAQPDEGEDLIGPVPLAVAGTVRLEGREDEPEPTPVPGDQDRVADEGRFIVVGDSDFPANVYFGQAGNGDLLLNCVNWLAQEAGILALRARDPENQPLVLSAVAGKLFLWIPVVVLPLTVAALALLALTARRRRR
ncbi:MAG: GldG family protein [Thermodesulfobacteriota bacterium]